MRALYYWVELKVLMSDYYDILIELWSGNAFIRPKLLCDNDSVKITKYQINLAVTNYKSDYQRLN